MNHMLDNVQTHKTHIYPGRYGRSLQNTSTLVDTVEAYKTHIYPGRSLQNTHLPTLCAIYDQNASVDEVDAFGGGLVHEPHVR